jgi:putative flippase GtrA
MTSAVRSAKDYKIALSIGLASAVLWFFVLKRLGFSARTLDAALIAVPLAFLLAALVAHRFFRTGAGGAAFHKGAKFLMVGVMNTGIDFFVFNALIAVTGFDQGFPVVLFKSISFLCALFNSYELNRLWTFGGEAAASRSAKEFGRFTAVTIVGFLVNVGTVAAVLGIAAPALGFSHVQWDNIAAFVATFVSLAWNFAGYSWFVFTAPPEHRRETSLPLPDVI